MPLRVMTYNILNGGKNRETYILDVIQATKPDVVILEEVFDEEFLQFLSRPLGMTYHLGTGNKKRKVALLRAKYVTNHIRIYQGEPCLIAGDFNAIAPGEKVKTESMPSWLKWIIYLQGNRVYYFSMKTFLSTGFTDSFRFLNSDEGFTLPPPHPNSRLDYILVNAEMKAYLKKCWVVREPKSVDLASDHYPVIAEFNL